MTEINLLPWREYQKEQQKKGFIIMALIGIISAVALVFLIDGYAVYKVNNQKERNGLLQSKVDALDKQIKELKHLKEVRAELISRMSTLSRLQSARVLVVHLFDELIQVMPSSAYLNKMRVQEEVITLWGYADSNRTISLLMNNIEGNNWMLSPALGEIKTHEFQLSFLLKPRMERGNF